VDLSAQLLFSAYSVCNCMAMEQINNIVIPVFYFALEESAFYVNSLYVHFNGVRSATVMRYSKLCKRRSYLSNNATQTQPQCLERRQ